MRTSLALKKRLFLWRIDERESAVGSSEFCDFPSDNDIV